VNVTNEKGVAVSGLTADNYQGSLHHKPIKIISVTQDDLPRRILVFLDASGSMTGDFREWQFAVSVANNLVASMPTGTTVGLFVFSSEIDRNIPLTQDRNVLQIELKNLRPGAKALGKGPHQTALWDTLAAGISELSGSQDGDVIYLISDGGDNASRTQVNELKKALVAKSIRVFVFLPTFAGGPSLEQPQWLNLVTLAEATGGTIVSAIRDGMGYPIPIVDAAGLPTSEGELLLMQFRQIFKFQRLKIELPERRTNFSDLNLKMKRSNAHNLVVTFPHELASCAAVMPNPHSAP
jgi:hypothetical protein